MAAVPEAERSKMNPPPRRIAHLDMDAFYASVELLRYPQLKGLPVVIGGRRRSEDAVLAAAAESGSLDRIPLADFPRIRDYVGRGVITTATYAARQFGVGSAMGIMKAAKLCPDAIMLPVDFDEYRRYSRLFKEEILKLAPVMENRGVDEVYIDFTAVPGGQEEGGRVLAETIQRAIFTATGLTCSIGVAPNKLLAKMAASSISPTASPSSMRAISRRRSGPCPAARSTASARAPTRSCRASASTPSPTSPRASASGCWSSSAGATAPGCTTPPTAATNARW
jgi:nucleotidyltransferase/DNA polymerase involved in DNA repair